MPMKVRYNVIDGEVFSETRGGSRKVYIPDALGNTVALMDSTGALTDTFEYFPSGTVASRTGTTPTPFQWVGNKGYYRDNSKRVHVRARNFYVNLGRWGESDPIGFRGGDYNLYRYVKNQFVTATDPSGKLKLTPKTGEWYIGSTFNSKSCCGRYQAVWDMSFDKHSKRFRIYVQKVQFHLQYVNCKNEKCTALSEHSNPWDFTYWEAWKESPSTDTFGFYRSMKGCSGVISVIGEMRVFFYTDLVKQDIDQWNDPSTCYGSSGDLACTNREPWFWDSAEEDTTEQRGRHSAGVSWSCCTSALPYNYYSFSYASPSGSTSRNEKCPDKPFGT